MRSWQRCSWAAARLRPAPTSQRVSFRFVRRRAPGSVWSRSCPRSLGARIRRSPRNVLPWRVVRCRRRSQTLPCGSLAPRAGFGPSRRGRARRRRRCSRELSEAGVETAILLRLEELTPQILVTFSVPFLWFGASEADFWIRVIHLPSRSVRLDARIKRTTGGPFHLRPPARAEEELVHALEQLLVGHGRDTP